MGKQKTKNRLPHLLKGSEFKRANPNHHRAANLKGLAIAIVVRAEEQKASKVRRRVWFTLWEKERKKAQEYAMRRAERNYRRDPRNYAPPDKKSCKPEGSWTRKWLIESLFGERVDWYRLHRRIFTELNKSPDHNCEWWRGVKDICEDVSDFDPVAEILKMSEEYAKSSEEPAKRKRKAGRPKVEEDEARRRRDLKAEWEQARDVKVSKTKFCLDKGIEVEYLNNSVLRYCRDHPQ